MLNKLKELSTDKEGYIVQSAANRKILGEASVIFDSAIASSPYKKAIEDYLATIPDIEAENGKYFNTLSSAYKPNRVFISNLKKQTIAELETLMLNEGLEAQIKQPLLNILNQNINSSARFGDMVKQVQEYITGSPELDGQLMRYSKQITTDSLFNYSRSLQQAITSDLGLEWYRYVGGRTEGGKYSAGSRPFCIERMGRYYHHSEIEKWASRDWSGKRRGTTSSTIFSYCGGYGCRHSLVPVGASQVPKSARERINE